MTTFGVRHITTYRYHRPVRFGEHQLMFRPRDSPDQRLYRAELLVDPAPTEVRWVHDVFGNCVALVGISRPAAELRFETRILLEHTPQAGPDLQIDAEALSYPFAYGPEEAPDLAPMIRPHYPHDEVERWARRFLRAGGPHRDRPPPDDALLRHPRGLRLFPAARSRGTQPPSVTLAAAARHLPRLRAPDDGGGAHLGLAARFVTGYVYVPDRDGPARPRRRVDHAWCQVYLPGRRLGGVRPHQRHRRQPRPHPRGGRARRRGRRCR